MGARAGGSPGRGVECARPVRDMGGVGVYSSLLPRVRGVPGVLSGFGGVNSVSRSARAPSGGRRPLRRATRHGRWIVKVKASVRRICGSCQVVRRKGKVRVICKSDPKHKQVQG